MKYEIIEVDSRIYRDATIVQEEPDATVDQQTPVVNVLAQLVDNTASNVGASGVGIFRDKSGIDLRFKKLDAGSSRISVTDDTGAGTVDVDVVEANLLLSNLGGTVGIAQGGTGQGSKTAAFDALAPSTTKGDLIVHDGADNVRLAKGTDGHVLKANSAAATGLEWGTVDASPLTTKGDLYTFDTDDARLAKGADGTFLRANSATGTGLEWGAISAGDVPNLSADKITSGTLDGARIPSLDASKITSGTFNDAQIPNLAAGKITSGTLDIARVPTIPAANVSAGTFPSGAFSFTTSVSAPVLTATDTSVATEGANVVTNGTFDADANWTKGTGWTISGGVATKTAGTAANLSQSIGVAANQVVRIRFTMTLTAGSLQVACGGVTHPTTYFGNGTRDIYIPATGTGALTFIADAGYAGTIDDVQANIITPRTMPINLPTFGTNNLAIGANALANVTTGANNVAIGIDALRSAVTNGENSALGYEALKNITFGAANVAIGYHALRNGIRLSENVAIGYLALRDCSFGSSNVAIGAHSSFRITTGNNNTAIGYQTLSVQTTASFNVAIGYFALRNRTTGGSNVAIGAEAGSAGTTATGGVFIGHNAGSNDTASNRLYIANSNTTTPLIFGQFSGTGAGLTIHSQATNGVPLIVKGIASQSSNLQQWQDSTGAVLGFVSAAGGLTINEQGADADTRIEGDTDANLLFVDASADSVQIGSATTADSAKFYVLGKISGSGEFEINGDLNHDGSNVGFYGTAPAAKGTVTGSRGGNAALASLLTALANIGLITDSSTA